MKEKQDDAKMKLRKRKNKKIFIRNDEEEDTDEQNVTESANEDNHQNQSRKFDPFKRSRVPFGSFVNELKHRYKKYTSDLIDGLSLHCLIASIFIFTVCVAPALCFGGILAEKSDQWFGINEMLLATSLNGIFFGLFSGQPLMIFGATGPFLVFEEMLYIVRLFLSRFVMF